jgi:hypothetical protein
MPKVSLSLIAFLFLTLTITLIGTPITFVSAGMYGLQPPPAPNAVVISPKSTENYSGQIPLTINVPMNGFFNLPSGYQGSGVGLWGIESLMYSLDGSKNATTPANTTLNQLPIGQHQLTLYANRWVYYGIYYGGEEDTVYLATVNFACTDNTAPAVTAIATPPSERNAPHLRLIDYLPAVLVIVAIVAIILFLIFWRRKTKTIA